MRNTWKRALSTLLTIAMVASLLIVPASAADDSYIAVFGASSTLSTGSIYTANVSSGSDVTYDITLSDNTTKSVAGRGALKANNDIQFTAPVNGTLYLYVNKVSSDRPVKLIKVSDSSETSYDITTGSVISNKYHCVTMSGLTAGTAYKIERGGSSQVDVVALEFVPSGTSEDATLAEIVAAVGEALDGKTSAKHTEAGDADAAKALVEGWIEDAVPSTATATVTVSSFSEATAEAAGSFGYAIEVAMGEETDSTISGTVAITYYVAATSVTISGDATADMSVGDTVTLTATVEPEGCSDPLKWESRDEGVATVSGGTVTAVAIGKTTITATAGEKNATRDVTVVGADQTGDSYTFESKKMGAVKAYGEATEVKYDNHFSVMFGSSTKVDTSSKSWTGEGIAYQSDQRLGMGGEGSATENALKITAGAAATVKVWWVANKAANYMQLLDSAGDIVTLGTEAQQSVTGGSDNAVMNSEFKIPEAGTYYLASGGGNGNYLFKVVVTETASEGGTVAADAVAAVLTAIGGGATAEAANFGASKGNLNTSDEDALDRFVVDALMAKMGTYAQQVEFVVNKAVYTPNEATTSLLADGEVKVGEIAYEVTVVAKGDGSDTATIKGAIDVMAAEGGDEPNPPTPSTQTVWTFENAKLNQSIDGYPFEGAENKFEGLTFHSVTSQNNGSNVTNKPYAILNTGSTITVPVSGKCDVEVTYSYGANATVGVGDDDTAVTTVMANNAVTTGTNPAVYHNGDESVTAVVITGKSGNTYVEKIEIKAYTAPTPIVSVPSEAKDTVITGTAPVDVQATVQNGTATSWSATSNPTGVADASVDSSGKVTVVPALNAKGKTTITVTATVDGETYSGTFTVWVKSNVGEIAAGEYNFSNKDDYYLTSGLSWTDLPHEGNGHGPQGVAGASMTVVVPAFKVATLTVTTCGYGDGLPITCEGATVGTATDATASGDTANASKVTVITNVTGNATVSFGAGTGNKGVFVHSLKVELADAPVAKTDLSEKTVTLKKGETALGSTAPVVDDVLTASVEGVNAADVDFIWTVGGTEVTANKTATYTVAAADMGKVIKVKAQAKDGSTTYENATPEVETSEVVGKTMTVSAENVSTVYDGNAKTIEVKGAPTGATITYCATEDGSFVADQPEMKNASDTPYTVYYKVTAAGYETATGSATITITKKAAPTNIKLEADTAEIEATGGTVTFTLTNIPADATVAPVGKCSEKPTETFEFVKQADGTYKGENAVAASTEGARTHNVTVTWEDPNYTKVEKTMTLSQLAPGAIKAAPATGLAPWAGVDYAALGATAAVSGQTVTLTIDEAKILAAYAADPETFKSGSMNHGGNAYMMIQFEAPTDVTTSWTVKQTVNGGAESAEWKLDGTGGDLDCWTAEDGKLMIGDWFGILMGVEGAAQSMPEANTYVMRYNFYEGSEMKAAVTYTVDRHVVKAAAVTLTANADLADVTVPAKISPEENFVLTVAVKAGSTKVLPNTITVKKNGTAMAAADYTWDQATGKVTIAAAKLASEDVIEITVTPVEPAPTEYDVTVVNGTADKAKAAAGVSVKVTADTAPTGKVFDKWTATGLTLTETDAAKAELTFTMPGNAVTMTATYKDEGGENPPAEEGYILTADALFAADQKTFAGGTPTKVGKDDFFTIHGKAGGESTVDVVPSAVASAGWDDGYKGQYRIKWGGTTMTVEGGAPKMSSMIEFTATGAGTVKVWFINNESTNVALFKADAREAVAISEAYTIAKNAAGVATVQIPEAGTYYLGYSKDKEPSKAETCKVQVIITGGGVVTVDKTALNAAITAAEAAIAAITVDTDAANVPEGTKWILAADKDTYQAAIDAAKAVAAKTDATETEVSGAVTALATATTAFEAAQKDGTKTSEQPTKPDTKALDDAIAAAKAAIGAANVKTQETALKGEKYVTAEDVAAYQAAVDAAEEALAAIDETSTAADVTAAVTALDTATKAFQDAVKTDGTALITDKAEQIAALEAAKAAAEEALEAIKDVTVKPAGTAASSVPKDVEFITEDVKNAMQAKVDDIAAALEKLNDAETPAEELPSAEDVTALVVATKQAAKDLPDAVQVGTYTNTRRPSGGGSSSSTNNNATVTLPDGSKQTVSVPTSGKVTVNVPDATTGTVAILVDKNGNETVVRDSIVVDGKMDLVLAAGDTVKIVNNAKSFVDVPGHWAEAEVDFVTARELFNGVDETHFRPDAAMNRGMMATVLFRLNGEKKVDSAANFVDVAAGRWYSEGVNWATAAGVINGYTDGTFAPEKSITRQELVLMVYRYAGAPAVDAKATLADFDDADSVAEWAEQAMLWAVENGIIQGKGHNDLDPQGNATRAEVSAVLQRYLLLSK